MANNINPFNNLVNSTPAVPGINTQVPQQNPAQPQCNIIWVDGMNDVLNHPTSPNSNLYFAERDNPVIWVRFTDVKGEIKNPLQKLTFSAEEIPFGPEANFVTKDEYKRLFDLVAGMNGKLEQLLNG